VKENVRQGGRLLTVRAGSTHTPVLRDNGGLPHIPVGSPFERLSFEFPFQLAVYRPVEASFRSLATGLAGYLEASDSAYLLLDELGDREAPCDISV
jgi:hypothetical protein